MVGHAHAVAAEALAVLGRDDGIAVFDAGAKDEVAAEAGVGVCVRFDVSHDARVLG
jgi:hypothetical protein